MNHQSILALNIGRIEGIATVLPASYQRVVEKLNQIAEELKTVESVDKKITITGLEVTSGDHVNEKPDIVSITVQPKLHHTQKNDRVPAEGWCPGKPKTEPQSNIDPLAAEMQAVGYQPENSDEPTHHGRMGRPKTKAFCQNPKCRFKHIKHEIKLMYQHYEEELKETQYFCSRTCYEEYLSTDPMEES